MKTSSLIALFLLISLGSLGQSPQERVAFGLMAGMQTGWWIFNAGSDDPNISNNQAWDRTHLALIWVCEANLRYKIQKFQFGASIGFLDLRDNIMIRSTDRPWNRDRYRIADVSLKGLFVDAILEYAIVDRPRYCFSPELKLGTFFLDHYSPEKPYMKENIHWSISINNEFKMSNFSLIITPTYSAALTFHNKPGFYHQRSEVLAFGIQTGIRFWLF